MVSVPPLFHFLAFLRLRLFEVIDKMAHDAMDSGSPQNTMRDVTEEEVKEIYRKLW